MTGLSDDARRLLRAGQTAFAPTPRELEATRVALKAKLSAGGGVTSGQYAGAAGESGLHTQLTQAASGTLLKLVVAGVVATSAGLGYLALRAEPSGSAPPPTAAAASIPEPPALAPRPPEQSGSVEAPAAAPEPPAKRTARSRRSDRARLRVPEAVSGKPSQPEPAASLPETPAPAAVSVAPVPEVEAAAANADMLAQEVEVIRRARAQLRQGHAEQAIRELDGYIVKFPNGRMREEQLALRALALCGLGRIEPAQNIVYRIQAVAPDSPHLSRIRRACRLTQ